MAVSPYVEVDIGIAVTGKVGELESKFSSDHL